MATPSQNLYAQARANGTPYVIAEIGINYQGSLVLAKDMMRVAKACGAHCAKFQKRTISRILCKKGLAKEYSGPNSFAPKDDQTYGAHKAALEMTLDQYRDLHAYATTIGIDFTASAWDEQSADELCSLGHLPFIKMASADLTNIPLLKHVAAKGVPMIISTGMASLEDVRRAVNTVRAIGPTLPLTVMQCTSSYPTPPNELNLSVIPTYRALFADATIGYSGHEQGTSTTLAAVAMGATVVERHFTLCKQMQGGDHKASLMPDELTRLCADIAEVAVAMGSSQKKIQPSEKACFLKLTKSIVSARPIKAGTRFTADDLTVKGPGADAAHLSPIYLHDLLAGGVALVDIEEDVQVRKAWVKHSDVATFVSPIEGLAI